MSNPFAMPESSLQSTPLRGTVRLKRVGVLSSGIFMGAAGAVLGLIAGGLAFLFSLGVASQFGSPQNALGAGMLVILLPLGYGIGGFIAGVIYALIYNIIAGMTGGLEMEFGQD